MPLSSLFLLIFVAIAAHIALAGARMTTALYALSLQASELTVGILLALFALLPMLFAVPMGRLIDRIGIKRPMAWGCLTIIAGCALPVLVPGLHVLYFAVPLVGTGFMAIHIGSQHTVGALSTLGNRSSNLSRLATGFSVSSITGPVLTGFIIDRVGFSFAYAACCGFALLALALLRFGSQINLAARPSSDKQKAESALDLLHHPELKPIYLAGILLAIAWDLFVFITPIRGEKLGFSASTIGLILGAFSLATFIIRLAMPWIARRHSEWQILTIALATAMLAYLMLPFMQEPAALMATAALLGLALGSAQPNVLALLYHAAPAGRGGEAIGIRATIGNATQVVVPIAFGAAGAALGLVAVFWAIAALIGTGLPLTWRRAFPSPDA